MEVVYLVNETFLSIDGEINPWHQGIPSFFIRLQNCNLRCPYCDTKQSWSKEGGKTMTVGELYAEAEKSGARKVTITGGEPFLQPLRPLIEVFTSKGYKVSVETNGSLHPCTTEDLLLLSINRDVSLIVDIKTPSSNGWVDWGFVEKVAGFENTWLKFVVANYEDLNFAHNSIVLHRLQKSNLAFSPVVGELGKLTYEDVLHWMLRQGYTNAVLNVQLHKLISMR